MLVQNSRQILQILKPQRLCQFQVVLRNSSTNNQDFVDDDPDDIFGFSGCKRDKRFYARCYRLLELENGSSQDHVRSQYIKLAKIHHPDSGQAASVKRFHRIDQAYRELMKKFNDDKKKEEESIGKKCESNAFFHEL